MRGSLYAKLLLWLALNLLLIVALFVAFPGRAGMGWNMLLSEPVRDRLLTIGERIGRDLSLTPEAGWEQVLASYGAEYGVRFSIDRGAALRFEHGQYQLQGPPPGGAPPDGKGLPTGAASAGAGTSADSAGRFGPPPDGGPDGKPPPPPPGGFAVQPPPGAPPDDGAGPGHAPPQFIERRLRGGMIGISRAHGQDGYELRLPARVERSGQPTRPVMLRVGAPSLRQLLRFLGVTEWLLFALLVIVLSALLWWPFIWGITRTVVRVTDATRAIAAGRFETRVVTRRRDELGRLAASVNRMAERLQNYVNGQKQFLADVAHEVTSPLARMQMGLGILEGRLDERAQRTLQDVQEEASQMSRLLNELLLFSRSGMEAEREPATAVELAPLLQQVLQREDPQQRVRHDLAGGLRVMARPALLERAVANLVRNALRYAGAAAVELDVARGSDGVHIFVRDRGPGVPESALPRLGEPFFRPELSRDRDSGGSGLGLAIVLRCIAACGGSVALRNRSGGGFEAEIRLEAA